MKLFAALTAAALCSAALPASVSAEPADVFSDDFSGTRLDPDKWHS